MSAAPALWWGAGPGAFTGRTRAEYDSLSETSFSRLKAMLRSPEHYLWALHHPREDTPALRLGRCEHLAILEPDRFDREVVVYTGRRAGAQWTDFEATHPGVEILSPADMDRCESMRDAVNLGSAEARGLLYGGSAEVSVLWDHDMPAIGGAPAYSVQLKARLDYVNSITIVDLKTCRDASPEGFGRAAWTYRMHTQAAMYVDGYRAATGKTLPYYLIAVETEPPHAVAVYRVTEEQLALGREEYWQLLDKIETCRRRNSWPSYGPTRDLVLPKWASNVFEDVPQEGEQP